MPVSTIETALSRNLVRPARTRACEHRLPLPLCFPHAAPERLGLICNVNEWLLLGCSLRDLTARHIGASRRTVFRNINDCSCQIATFAPPKTNVAIRPNTVGTITSSEYRASMYPRLSNSNSRRSCFVSRGQAVIRFGSICSARERRNFMLYVDGE